MPVVAQDTERPGGDGKIVTAWRSTSRTRRSSSGRWATRSTSSTTTRPPDDVQPAEMIPADENPTPTDDEILGDPAFHARNAYALVMRTLAALRVRARTAGRRGASARPPAQGGAARLRRGQRLLLTRDPRRSSSATSARAQRRRLHVPLARRRRPRDHPRPARRTARPVHGAVVARTRPPSTRASPTSSRCSRSSRSRARRAIVLDHRPTPTAPRRRARSPTPGCRAASGCADRAVRPRRGDAGRAPDGRVERAAPLGAIKPDRDRSSSSSSRSRTGAARSSSRR